MFTLTLVVLCAVFATIVFVGVLIEGNQHKDKLGYFSGTWVAASIVTGFVAFTLIFSALAGAADSVTCRNTASLMDEPHHWSFSTGCLIKDQGRWIPRGQIISNSR